ncbi:MAG: MlaE family ABC transporter permease [Pseudomonadota bacterium]
MADSSASPMTALAGATGRQLLRLPNYLVELTAFLLAALRDWRQGSQLLNRATYSSLVGQVIFGGIDALPAITLLALASGLGIVSQLIVTVQVFGETQDVVKVLTQVVALELGSLLTAIVLIGRSGSAIAVDLGNMKLHREIEGLELLGINVNHFFITPRLLGTTLSQTVLAVYFSVLTVFSGVAVAALFVNAGYFKYLAEIPLAFTPGDLVIFVLKNMIFGLLIGTVACYHGLRVGRSPTEVPQQAQRAVINSLTLIFVLDGLVALVSP